jgi:hypothetical protein
MTTDLTRLRNELALGVKADLEEIAEIDSKIAENTKRRCLAFFIERARPFTWSPKLVKGPAMVLRSWSLSEAEQAKVLKIAEDLGLLTEFPVGLVLPCEGRSLALAWVDSELEIQGRSEDLVDFILAHRLCCEDNYHFFEDASRYKVEVTDLADDALELFPLSLVPKG